MTLTLAPLEPVDPDYAPDARGDRTRTDGLRTIEQDARLAAEPPDELETLDGDRETIIISELIIELL